MSEEMLNYYNRELAYLRRQGAEFARAYPKVAGRLRISEEAVEDPHVSRLLEGVAFLTAQIRQRLDGHFPELAEILMGTLYPDYQAPIPSMTVLQLEAGSAQTHVASLSPHQFFETVVEQMPACRFQSSAEYELAPISVTAAKFENSPFDAPLPAGAEGAQSAICLRLKAPVSLREINASNLRFYLHGQVHQSHELYDLIHRTGLGFAVVSSTDRRQLAYFPAEAVSPMGFADDEALVPYSERSFAGFRLLVEHFLFPEKFLYAHLGGLAGHWPDTTEVDLYIYLSETSAELEKSFIADHMRLWCVPVVNWFDETLEPIRREDGEHEYRLVPRFQNAEAFEVIGIDAVSLINSGKARELAPYYGMGHPRWQDEMNVFWHSQRRSSDWAGGQYEPGTETYLTLVDKSFGEQNDNALPNDEMLVVKARCCNRNLPGRLPFGGGNPRFRAVAEPLIEHASALIAPTSTVRPEVGDASRWQFVRHLNLEHFSGEDAAERLKAVLQLHDFRGTPESRALIEGIEDVKVIRAVARVGSGVRRGVCQGSEIRIQFSKPRYAGASVYLFSAVLDHFFAQFAQINTFTRLRIRLSGHSQDYHVWPARSGERELL